MPLNHDTTEPQADWIELHAWLKNPDNFWGIDVNAFAMLDAIPENQRF